MHDMPTTSELRNLIDEYLIGDSELEAFVMDHFPHVKRLYGHGMDRTAKVNLLFERADCDQIHERLRNRPPQVANAIGAYAPARARAACTPTNVDTGEATFKTSRRYRVVLSGTIDDMDGTTTSALMDLFRKISGDAGLTLEEIKAGSIILHLRGSVEGMERLREAFRAGTLREVLGYRLEGVFRDEKFTSVEDANPVRVEKSLLDLWLPSVEPHVHVITGPVRVRRRGEDPVEPVDPVTLTPHIHTPSHGLNLVSEPKPKPEK